MQHTFAQEISIDGIGLHSGHMVSLRLRPAPVDHGIVFQRVDITDKDNIIPARWDHVVDTRLCTVIGNKDGVTIGTIEHLMAALRGCGVDNALIELNGPEVPVLDGSSIIFVQHIDRAGLQQQVQPRRAIKVLKEIIVEDDNKQVSLAPSNNSSFGGSITYDHPNIGEQYYETKLVNGNFKHDIAECRTFGFLKDVEAMRAAGLALGGSLDNAIVLDDTGVLNDEGLRHDDEFIRHKILDAVGDLYLAGGPIIGSYQGARAGHALNNKLLHALFADENAWCIVDLYAELDEAGYDIATTKDESSVAIA